MHQGALPVITTAGLTKHYGTVHALTDLTVEVGAVIGAHAGPGLVGVVVVPADA